ncbi:hypothetical protein [Carboxylicivirga sp. RSCT41]|uniref:hypothetical protein n=1 Tax=Carboxylicivirga agarovorans TaxID=3417570 RepID=UPI003D3354D5
MEKFQIKKGNQDERFAKIMDNQFAIKKDKSDKEIRVTVTTDDFFQDIFYVDTFEEAIETFFACQKVKEGKVAIERKTPCYGTINWIPMSIPDMFLMFDHMD